MKMYVVRIEEVYSVEVEVVASDENDAENVAREMYDSGESSPVLDGDLDGVTFETKDV